MSLQLINRSMLQLFEVDSSGRRSIAHLEYDTTTQCYDLYDADSTLILTDLTEEHLKMFAEMFTQAAETINGESL